MKYKIKDYNELLTLVNNMSINELLKVVICPDIPVPCEDLDTSLISLLLRLHVAIDCPRKAEPPASVLILPQVPPPHPA